MTDLETFCKLEIASTRRVLRSSKKGYSITIDQLREQDKALGQISAYQKVLTRIKNEKAK